MNVMKIFLKLRYQKCIATKKVTVKLTIEKSCKFFYLPYFYVANRYSFRNSFVIKLNVF